MFLISVANGPGDQVVSDTDETWRCAGDARVGYGFELTQDKANQEVRQLCGLKIASSHTT